MGLHDLWYPAFVVIVCFLISKIQNMNLLWFLIIYIVSDMLHNMLYILIIDNYKGIESIKISLYNSGRFGLLILFTALLKKRIPFFLIIIPVSLALSDQLMFWVGEVINSAILKMVENDYLFLATRVIPELLLWNLIEGTIVAIVFVLVRKLQSYISNFEYDSITKEA